MRLVLLLLLLSLPLAYAQVVGYTGNVSITGVVPSFGVDWSSVPLKYPWDYVAGGFCAQNSQCLVSASFNESFDDNPLAYFTGASPGKRPKCIASGQYILDHYCEDGGWTSRTRRVAEQLLALAYATSDSFRLYCDFYTNALNKYDYFTDYGFAESLIRYPWCKIGPASVPCVNNFCVLEYEYGVAFGASLNVPVNDAEDSFLFALNRSRNHCSAVTSGDSFQSCGGMIYYNPVLNAIIYSNDSLPAPSPAVRAALDVMRDNVLNYSGYVHSPPLADLSFMEYPPSFSRVYVARDVDEFVFSYKESGISAAKLDYAGWHFSDINLPGNFCSYFKLGDSRVYCDSQPFPDNFFVVSFRSPPPLGFVAPRSVVDDWSRFVGSLRI